MTTARRSAAPADLRMPLVGLAAWAGALITRGPQWLVAAALLAALLGAVGLAVLGRRGSRAVALTGAAVLLAALGTAGVSVLRQQAVAASPVARLAAERAVVTVRGNLVSDPKPMTGRYGDRVVARLDVTEVTGRGLTQRLRSPVLVIGGDDWSRVRLGATLTTAGRLAPADDPQLSALLLAVGEPRVLRGPDLWWRAASAVRDAVRRSVAGRPAEQRALLPALVDGDDTGVTPQLAADFRATGLTHLLAVSGTNLTIVVGFVLAAAGWCGVRGRGLLVVGGLGIAGFVLLARTEPSVLRAAVMGAVGLVAMGGRRAGRQRALRTLGVAVTGLLLLSPALAVAAGFALSVLATAGIVVLGPTLRDALGRWLPRWAADAVAVPTAAQLATTPLVAALSGQVSLVAVGANLLAAPVVGPATVLGLGGGLVGLVSEPASRMVATPAAWCVGWIAAVARGGAGLPLAAVPWGSDGWSLARLVVLTLAVAVGAPLVLRRRLLAAAVAVALTLVVLGRAPTPGSLGWPPTGWLLVMCDVGQGDALVLRAGPRTAVVVDAGPDPALVDGCLHRLRVDAVPLVVLTHLHADHVDGLSGVLDGRRVGEIDTTRVLDPPAGAAQVQQVAGTAGLALRPVQYGATRTVGAVTLQVLWPGPGPLTAGAGDGSAANDASVVLLVEVAGVRLLLTGDVEPPGQAALARAVAGLDVDVLKVPHHGSRYQDLGLLTSLRPETALVSVGADNDYGHPNAGVLDALTAAGARVLRTDQAGEIAVVSRDGQVSAVTR